jgi:hypothetical protein
MAFSNQGDPKMKAAILPLVALSGWLCAAERTPAETPGIPPKPSRAEYDVTGFTESFAVGASLLTPAQVRALFGQGMDRAYMVVEVGCYSKDRTPFAVRRADFALRPPKSPARVAPEAPAEVARKTGPAAARVAAAALPEVRTTRAVAGYLFFPAGVVPSSAIELEYQGNGTWLTLPLR